MRNNENGGTLMTSGQPRGTGNDAALTAASIGQVASVRRYAVSFMALLLLVLFFLFVPLLQGFQLSAGQDLPDPNDPFRAVDRLAVAEVNSLAQRN